VIGVGEEGVRRIPVDGSYSMRPEALQQAIDEDRRRGRLPFCVVGTLGTTGSTAIDPCVEIGRICKRERLWFHIDAAYGGAAAFVPEMRRQFDGWEGADSIVFNLHKWLFTPFDASLLLFREPELFRDAFSLVPEYVRTPTAPGIRNYGEYGVQLGRRFRALKVWMQIRYFGADGIAARIRDHCRMAAELVSWVEADPHWELLAPVPFATVCLRYRPDLASGRSLDSNSIDSANERILERVNRDGRIFLSHTRLDNRFTIRVVIGNPRATDEHVARCWQLLKEAAAK